MKTLAALLASTVTLLLTAAPSRGQQVAFCAPDCTAAEVGDKVRVPWNCAQYAVCVDPLGDGDLYPTDPVDCPEGEYFEVSHDIPRCDPAEGADPGFCGKLCDPCEILCEFQGETTPDPQNCTLFHICLLPGSPSDGQCPSGSYYNYIEGKCQESQSKCFDQYCDECQVHCIEEGNIPDPYDCNKFYYCNPPLLVHGSCPPGDVFDQATSLCTEDTTGTTCSPCSSLEHSADVSLLEEEPLW